MYHLLSDKLESRRASLTMLPRMESISDCNVMFVERRVVKPLKTWLDSMETFLFKSIEKI